MVADTFNTFFSEQIVKLQSNIDDNLKEDPMEKLKTNSKLNKKKFSIKTITEETTLKTIKRMHKKKTACCDGLSQEQLKLGSSILMPRLN